MLERLITFGHGTATQEAFVELLHGTGVDEIVDIRSFPGSRHNPQFGREEMHRWLAEAGVGYRWMPELGGRRKPDPDSRHIALHHKSFRAYADHMESPEFIRGVDDLLRSET